MPERPKQVIPYAELLAKVPGLLEFYPKECRNIHIDGLQVHREQVDGANWHVGRYRRSGDDNDFYECREKLAAEMRTILRPNGWAVHSIDTADHLEHYDRTVSPKMYLSFSETTWRRLCENEVQYINRLQRGEWLGLFKANGFELIEEEVRRVIDLLGK